MVLGTVELGLCYGINNASGKPGKEEAFGILDHAFKGGILELDTAVGYGDSEAIVGEYMRQTGNRFLIDTKFSKADSNSDNPSFAFHDSLKRLGEDSVEIMYMHSFSMCRDKNTVSALCRLREENRIKKIGISIYEPQEMEHILCHCPYVDVIQFPYSIMDSKRWEENGLLERAKKSKKTLYARSIFLQGLLFCNPDDNRVQSKGASRQAAQIHTLAKEHSVSIAELAYAFVSTNPCIDDVLLGCETTQQMDENLGLLKSQISFSEAEKKMIIRKMSDIPAKAIDPRQW